jgi:hypothetical protein
MPGGPKTRLILLPDVTVTSSFVAESFVFHRAGSVSLRVLAKRL